MSKRFYITTPIYYVNAPPHLGHAYADTLADVLARYHRLLGEEVFFLTGTDEHGANVVRAAEKSGKDIAVFVREGREIFKKLAAALLLSNDDFIFTSDEKRHWPVAQALWKKLAASGDIYKGVYKGLYCLGHEAFITEKDLEDGKCRDHGEAPQLIEEENYFFRLSKYTEEIKRRIHSGEFQILPTGRKNEILSLLNEGLKDISFSRPAKDISWGIPVPGDHTQTMYVWCDALSNYLSVLGYGSDDESKFIRFWPADIHIIGKDILRFHAAFWPAMLLSAGLALPKTILVHGLIQVGGRKMSKTLGNVVNPFDIIERYGVEPVRYFLLRELPVFEDGQFSEDKFREVYEGNLVNGVGNYIRRVATMIQNSFDGKIERPSEENIDKALLKRGEVEYVSVPYFINHVIWPEYHKAMESFEPNRAADAAFSLIKELDGYVQHYEPFKLVKTDRETTHVILWNLCYGAVSLAWMLSPFLPETSDKILDIFSAKGERESEWKVFTIKAHPPLFPRLR